RRVGPDWKRQLGVRRPATLHVFLIVLLLPGFLILPNLVQEVVTRVTGLRQPVSIEALNGVFRQVSWFVTLLAVGLGPGVVEEVWCRGFLGRGLCARYGLVAGVILTSVFFGLLHMDPAYAIVTAMMGAFLYFVYLGARSIWVPILLHTLNNSVAVLASLLRI